MRILLQVRTGEESRAASSRLGAAHVCGYPYAAMCHVLHLTVTACKCPEQAVSAEAEANMKNPSKSGSASTREAPPPRFFYAAKIPFFSGRCPVTASWQESQQPGQEQRGLESEYRLLTCEQKSDYPNMYQVL